MLRAALPVLLLLPGCATELGHVPAATMLGSDSVELPCNYQAGYFLVQAYLDGEGPYAFLVDTGTDRLVVDARVAERHHRSLRSTELAVRSATGQSAPMDQLLRVRALSTGGAVFRELEAGVLDLEPLGLALGTQIDGLLGCSVFTDCLLTLDYPRREVRLTRGTLPPVDGQEVLAITGNTPWVEGALSGRAMRFLIDSGFGRELTIPPDMPGLAYTGPPRAFGEVVTITGTHRQYLARVAGSLQLGRHRIANPVATLAPGSPKIGARVLRRFTVTLDVAHGRVRLRR